MQAENERDDPEARVAAVAAARDRMDSAIVGYNRHANIVERFRLAVMRARAHEVGSEVGEREREQWRDARLAASARRLYLRAMMREYVQRLREEGVEPERVIVAVKGRIALAATPVAPAAPHMDADALMHDASQWIIAAYYEAA